MIEIEQAAPDFSVTTHDGTSLNLKDLRGKWIVLYFYPKDNTPGCTKEACSFRDNMERITSIGAVVIGVSPDSAKSHKGFTEKHELNFHLLPDPEKEISIAYGAYGEKKMCGKLCLGITRSTFIIDPEGIVKYVFPNVKVEGHVEAVINKLQELQK